MGVLILTEILGSAETGIGSDLLPHPGLKLLVGVEIGM